MHKLAGPSNPPLFWEVAENILPKKNHLGECNNKKKFKVLKIFCQGPYPPRFCIFPEYRAP